MSQEVSVLRVVVVCNVSGTLLADYAKPEWTFNREDKAIGSLVRSLLSIAKEFDDGIVHFVSFKIPAESQSKQSSANGPPSLNLAVTLKNDVVTGIFYRVNGSDSKLVESQNARVEQVANQIYEGFAAEHLQYYNSIKPQLEEAFQKSEEVPPEKLERLSAFADKIPSFIDL